MSTSHIKSHAEITQHFTTIHIESPIKNAKPIYGGTSHLSSLPQLNQQRYEPNCLRTIQMEQPNKSERNQPEEA